MHCYICMNFSIISENNIVILLRVFLCKLYEWRSFSNIQNISNGFIERGKTWTELAEKNTITINFPLNYNQHIRRRCVEGVVSDVHCHLALWLEWYGIYLQSDYNWKYPSHSRSAMNQTGCFNERKCTIRLEQRQSYQRCCLLQFFTCVEYVNKAISKLLQSDFGTKITWSYRVFILSDCEWKIDFFYTKSHWNWFFRWKQCWFNKFGMKTANNDSKVYIIRFYRRKKRFKYEMHLSII